MFAEHRSTSGGNTKCRDWPTSPTIYLCKCHHPSKFTQKELPLPHPSYYSSNSCSEQQGKRRLPSTGWTENLRWLDHLRMAHVFILAGSCLLLLLVMSDVLLCQGDFCWLCGRYLFGVRLKSLRETFSRASRLSHDMHNLSTIMFNQIVSTVVAVV